MLKLTFRLIHAVEVLFILKGIVHKEKKKKKFCHHLLSLKLFQTWFNFSSAQHKRRHFEECW